MTTWQQAGQLLYNMVHVLQSPLQPWHGSCRVRRHDIPKHRQPNRHHLLFMLLPDDAETTTKGSLQMWF
jgi:hypothetical protein